MVLLRDLRRRDRRLDARAAARRRDRADRRHRRRPCSRSTCCSRRPSSPSPDSRPYNAALELGAVRLRQQHGVAHLRRVHVRAGLREDRARAPHRAAAGASRWAGSTLGLGYAIAVADTLLAPFTPSNTARSGGTIYPVIRNLPALYDSKPNDPSSRRIGSYLMWVAIATTCVTSSMFLTAPRAQPARRRAGQQDRHMSLTWTQWFVAFAPIGIVLLAADPARDLLALSAGSEAGDEVPKWAARSSPSWAASPDREIILGVLVLLALAMWIFGGEYINATTAALVVICLMLVLGVVSWDDIVKNFAGMEHAGVVRDPGRAGRRPQPRRLRQVVRRQHRRRTWPASRRSPR